VDGYSQQKLKLKKDFIKPEEVKVYPDTTVWIKDFNEPMHNDYFWHKAYGDYPVGVKWTQAKAFVLGEH
jgi:hypothetical protein